MNIEEYIQSGAIEAYVLGLADDNDIAELHSLKERHPEVTAAIDAAEKWLKDYARSHGIPPAGDVRANFLFMLKTETATPVLSTPVYRQRPPNWYKMLAAACVLLLMVSAGYMVHLHRQYTRAVNDYALVSNPSVIKVPLLGVGGKDSVSATLYWDSNNKNVYLDPAHLPNAPSGMQYQLWALVDGKPLDAGLLEKLPGICRLKTIQRAQAFAITLEKAGGSPTPTLTQMVVLGNVKS